MRHLTDVSNICTVTLSLGDLGRPVMDSHRHTAVDSLSKKERAMGQAKKKGSAMQTVSRRGLLRVAAGAVAVGAAMRPRHASAQEKFTLWPLR